MRRFGRISAFLCAVLVSALPASPSRAAGGDAEILQSWHGDLPTARLELLPEDQRDLPAGFLDDAGSFGEVWQAMNPGQEVPEVDFESSIVLFARNTQFYNRLSIGKVTVSGGVAELLAMETMSALPVEEKAAISLVVVPRKGIEGLKAGETVLPLPGF
jgi:hypothetical protein